MKPPYFLIIIKFAIYLLFSGCYKTHITNSSLKSPGTPIQNCQSGASTFLALDKIQSPQWKKITADHRLETTEFVGESQFKEVWKNEFPLLSPILKVTQPDLAKILKWQDSFVNVDDCAQRARKRAKSYKNFNECLLDTPESERQLVAAKKVFEEFSHSMLHDPHAPKLLRAVEDHHHNIQCIVLIRKKPYLNEFAEIYPKAFAPNIKQIPALEVEDIIVAPWNLTPSDPRKLKGAGTACLKLAMLESRLLPWKGAVILEAVPSAVAFYEKFGFTAFDEAENPEFGVMPVMWLSPEDSQKNFPRTLPLDSK